MSQTFISILSCLGLFIGMILLSIAGQRVAKRRASRGESTIEGTGTVTAAVFALLGLMLAFTFDGAFSRFDNRRQLAIQQANAVGTAYSRVDIMPQEMQAPMREYFRKYVAARLAIYANIKNPEIAYAHLDTVKALHGEIWSLAAEASQKRYWIGEILLPSVNEMIDITTMQIVTIDIHPPLLIWIVLFMISLACSLLVGYGADPDRPLSRLHIIGLAATVSFVIYVILDVEYPESGFIRLEYLKFLLEDLAEQMGA